MIVGRPGEIKVVRTPLTLVKLFYLLWVSTLTWRAEAMLLSFGVVRCKRSRLTLVLLRFFTKVALSGALRLANRSAMLGVRWLMI